MCRVYVWHQRDSDNTNIINQSKSKVITKYTHTGNLQHSTCRRDDNIAESRRTALSTPYHSHIGGDTICICAIRTSIYTHQHRHGMTHYSRHTPLLVPCPQPHTINPSKVLTKPHTGKEKPHPSTTTEGSKPCATKCRRPGGEE